MKLLQWRVRLPVSPLLLLALLAGCAGERARQAAALPDPAAARAAIERAIPPRIADRSAWAGDIAGAFAALGIGASDADICAVVAVIQQESGFQVNPVIPGLPAIAWREIDARAARAGVPRLVLHGMLMLPSAAGPSYAERIDHAHTEKQLSDVYEEFIGRVPLGRTLFSDRNPIRTRGPMQVQVTFAERFAAQHAYPFPVEVSIGEELFTRRGGIYFGVAHLLDYPAHYDRYLYRFADYNAGQYASRNAAFQQAVSLAGGMPLQADGALLPHTESDGPGPTELALRSLGPRLDLPSGAIHETLERAHAPDFEESALYRRVFELAEQRAHRALPRAQVPRIELKGPKLSRTLSTLWYAERVDARFTKCLQR